MSVVACFVTNPALWPCVCLQCNPKRWWSLPRKLWVDSNWQSRHRTYKSLKFTSFCLWWFVILSWCLCRTFRPRQTGLCCSPPPITALITPEESGSDKYYLHTLHIAQNAPSFKNRAYNCCLLIMSLSIWSDSFLSLSHMQAWFHVGDSLKWLLWVFLCLWFFF